ncbi:MAG: acyloxyacyl hydrolase [Chitinophagaceae bacterium]
MRNAYFGVNIGYINYPFSSAQLERGYSVESVSVPHTAVRIVLYGCPINQFLSARITYMRPVNWVEYRNVNGDRVNHSVWMNIAGLTLEGRYPISRKFSLTAEAGLSVITRNGFEINGVPVVKNANYGTGLLGGAIRYHVNPKWDLQLSSAWSPPNKKVRQPETLFFGAGFNYNLRPLPDQRIKHVERSGLNFPREILFAGITRNDLGYGVNDFVSKGAIPIFWGGDAHVRSGFSLSYQRNIFHTRKVFAMDWAVHTGIWKSRDRKESFFTFSLNPVLRFNALRTKPLDLFFEYSVAGPSFISKILVDNVPLGRKFTFHDFMGMGVFAGKQKKIYAGLRIAHYSNGNIFPQNDGVKVPLTLNLGYVLK